MTEALAIHLALAFGILLAVMLVVQILRSRRPPAATLGWLVLIVALPYLGVPLYLALGTRKLPGRRTTPPRAGSTSEAPIDRLLDGLATPPARTGDRVVLHRDGVHAMAALDDILLTAHSSIDLCVYQLDDDQAGGRWLDQLIGHAHQGVRVRILLDGVGSWGLSRQRISQLKAAGVQLAHFIPVLHRPLRGRTNLRNHRKLVVVDGRAAWTGGRNLSAVYFTGTQAWVDLSLSLHGPSVADLTAVFERDWRFATGQPEPPSEPDRDIASDPQGLRIIPSGPDVAGDPLHDLLLCAVGNARHRVLAVTPYFVPGDCLQQALCLAARQGVAIDLILPARSNHPTADIARERYLRGLHDAGVRLWLVDDVMVHAKALVVDDALALTGSANLDLRSLFLNFELGLLLRAPDQVQACATWVSDLRDAARPYRPRPATAWRESIEGLVLLFAYQL